ncbi:AAA family ATPase [Chloroflexota bacterium]
MLPKFFLRKSYNVGKYYSNFDLESYQPIPVTYQLRGAILRKVRAGQALLTDIDGREETKADVLRALLSGAHPYLVSEEGTGKTRLARSLTRLLPPIPIIGGCPYHDDPKWPPELLCPRCRVSKNPVKEYGIDFVSGDNRFSRIQGNEYTNEAKLLGLKDIQAIAQGRSPADPQVFTGTGVFRANRGILFVDELPAIRTKVQVLFHPILEEKKAILEEYNWEHPLDLILIATGNPRGFTHVNEIPRPLLDRLEPVYMDLPEEDVEREIMLKETFHVRTGRANDTEDDETPLLRAKDVDRKVVAPWWIIDIVNKVVRYSRTCPYVERKPSLRATNRALDHTFASAELDNRSVVNLRHAYYGLRLALRGRVGLRADLLDFDDPAQSFRLGDELVTDFMWNVFEDMKDGAHLTGNGDSGNLGAELASLLSGEIDLSSKRLPWAVISGYEELARTIGWMRDVNREKLGQFAGSELPLGLNDNPNSEATDEVNYSALEILVNLCLHQKTIDRAMTGGLFVPHKYEA